MLFLYLSFYDRRVLSEVSEAPRSFGHSNRIANLEEVGARWQLLIVLESFVYILNSRSDAGCISDCRTHFERYVVIWVKFWYRFVHAAHDLKVCFPVHFWT